MSNKNTESQPKNQCRQEDSSQNHGASGCARSLRQRAQGMAKRLRTGLGVLMHVSTVVALTFSMQKLTIAAGATSPETVDPVLWSIKYLLFAILFQIVALNCRNS